MTFSIVPPKAAASATLGTLIALQIGVAAYLVRFVAPSPEITAIIGLVVTVGVAGVLAYFLYGSFHSAVTIGARSLELKAPFYGRSIPRDSIDAARARVISMHAGGEVRFRIRTNGLAVPGYRVGWFRLSDKTRALAAVTDSSRVAHVPLKDGSALLVSVAKPDEFIQALAASPQIRKTASMNE